MVASGRKFEAFVAGPYGSGKTTALAQLVRDAYQAGVDLSLIAAFAPTRLMFRRLAATIAAPWPEVERPELDLFAPELCGVPFDALAGHAAGGGRPTGAWFEAAATRDWLAFIARTSECDLDEDFLKRLAPRFKAALRVDHFARLSRAELPRNTYLAGAAAFVADFKRRKGLVDKADLLRGDYRVSPEVRLLALDEVSEIDRAILARFFPNASVIATGLAARPADIEIKLERTWRTPERLDLDAETPPELSPPPPDDFASLFIIAPRWRRSRWRAWSTRYGVPAPVDDWRFRAIVAAWRLDEGEEVGAYALNPLLAGAGLEVEEGGSISPGDIAGWTDWRDLARRFDPAALAQAEAALERYGRLDSLPLVRMGEPWRVRGIEAEAAIVDCAGLPPATAELAISRAIKWQVALGCPTTGTVQ